MTQKNDNLKTVSFLLQGYECTEESAGDIVCKSDTGIADEGLWENFFINVKSLFGDKFKEIYHETCYNHKHFHIYYNQ